MPSPLDICNLALAQLGDTRIDSFEDPTRVAVLCGLHYPLLRDALACEMAPHFARHRQRLAANPEPLGSGFAQTYALPTDPYCLQVLSMDGEETNAWAVEGRFLLTDALTATILYIARIDDAGAFAGAFTLALVERLSAQLAYGLTGDVDVEKVFLAKAAQQIATARAADEIEQSLIPSALSLANLALVQIGQTPITTLKDNSQKASLAALFYPQIRDALLRQGHWKFARRRITLDTPTTTPAWGAPFAFALPGDCLQVLYLEDDHLTAGTGAWDTSTWASVVGDGAWTVEGRELLTCKATVNLVYIRRVTDITQFDAEFTLALVDKLAMQLGFALTGQATATRLNAELYVEALREARHANGREGSPQQVPLPDMFTRNR